MPHHPAPIVLALSLLDNPGFWLLLSCVLAIVGCVAWTAMQHRDDIDRRGRW